MVDPDQERFDRIGDELVESAAADLGAWLRGLVESRLDGRPLDEEAERLTNLVSGRIVADLRRLVDTEISAQRTTPLSVVRVGIAPLTDWLDRVGVAPPARDSDARRLYPDDRFELGPDSFGEISPRMQAAGISWGAGKAHMHLKGRSRTI